MEIYIGNIDGFCNVGRTEEKGKDMQSRMFTSNNRCINVQENLESYCNVLYPLKLANTKLRSLTVMNPDS